MFDKIVESVQLTQQLPLLQEFNPQKKKHGTNFGEPIFLS
jgi:hypothetical protein